MCGKRNKVNPNTQAPDEEKSLTKKQKKPVEISITCKYNRQDSPFSN